MKHCVLRPGLFAFVYQVIFCILIPYSVSGTETLLEHNQNPLQAESTLDGLSPWETPISAFFIRSHHPLPEISEKKWILQIEGLVEHPKAFKLKDLKRMPKISIHAVLECSGNKRGLQEPRVSGILWGQGAVGNAEWTGVPLREVLNLVKIKKGAKFVTLEGADVPLYSTVPKFIRSIPLEKALQNDVLLAWEMNREPLPKLHGGPVRLVLPGWYGENWMKWVTKISISEKEDTTFYMKKGYRLPKEPVQPGQPWDSSTGTPIERILVQSLITSPLPTSSLPPDSPIMIRGKAFSGERTIRKVEVTLDGGNSWKESVLESPHSTGGWQEFSIETRTPRSGKIVLGSRAVDSAGEQQPLNHTWNPGGYLRNAVDLAEIQISPEPPLQGAQVAHQKCVQCHTLGIIESQRLSTDQWKNVLKKMENFGVQLSTPEYSSLLDYLKQYSPNLPLKVPQPLSYSRKNFEISKLKLHGNSKQGSILFNQNCAVCHGKEAQGALGPRLKGRWVPQASFYQTILDGKNIMPSFKNKLSSQQIEDIYKYLAVD